MQFGCLLVILLGKIPRHRVDSHTPPNPATNFVAIVRADVVDRVRDLGLAASQQAAAPALRPILWCLHRSPSGRLPSGEERLKQEVTPSFS